jgi:hypothetical protein
MMCHLICYTKTPCFPAATGQVTETDFILLGVCAASIVNSKVSVQYIMQINLQMQDLDPGSNYARKEL